MSYVFISYSSQSEDVVKTLAQDIGALGHKVWFDEELVGGQVWWSEILTKIRDCDVFAFLLTPEALESTPCQLEYKYADSLGKPILPILAVDDVSIDLLPSALSKLQYVDYRRQDKQAAFALVKAFSSLPPAQPLPDPLPQPPRLPVSYLGTLKEQVEATEMLSFPEQTALLMRLKERLSEPKNADEVYRLLARLRKRDDLFAKVADEIDLALATMKESSSSSAPSLTQASTSERKVNVEALLPTSKPGDQASGPNTTTGQAKEPITDSKDEPERNFVNKQADDFIRPYPDLFLPLISRTELKNSAANGNPLAKAILERDNSYDITFEHDRLVECEISKVWPSDILKILKYDQLTVSSMLQKLNNSGYEARIKPPRPTRDWYAFWDKGHLVNVSGGRALEDKTLIEIEGTFIDDSLEATMKNRCLFCISYTFKPESPEEE